ncbi:STAS domain-containing protein [Mycolicibacterium lacusdiani]|uniref:STAS domain-containing protein n=1 Tax=Mycolicibacterium lacusdiani TaxID=2895283 RepID=UPI001F359D25|nr:STAS domain-containing protein [Mycolicibacterium lacusdiani]
MTDLGDLVGASDDAAALAACTVGQRIVGDVVVVCISGVLDLVTAPTVEAALDEALGQHPAALIVDLLEVDFLAAAGMTVLLRARERIGTSARFAVVAAGSATARPMKAIGISDQLGMQTSLGEALQAVRV